VAPGSLVTSDLSLVLAKSVGGSLAKVEQIVTRPGSGQINLTKAISISNSTISLTDFFLLHDQARDLIIACFGSFPTRVIFSPFLCPLMIYLGYGWKTGHEVYHTSQFTLKTEE